MKFTLNRILSGFMQRNILNHAWLHPPVFQSFLNAFDINHASVVSLRLQSSGVWVRVVWRMSTNISEDAVSCMLRADEACNLKMEAAGSSETSVPMYQTARRYKLEDRSLNADHWRVQNLIIKGSATQKSGCRGGQAVAGNRGGLRSADATQGSAAKSGPV